MGTQLKRKRCMIHLKNIFLDMDADGSGTISRPELEYSLALADRAVDLEALDINTDDLQSLFSFLDMDSSGAVSIEEFCHVCLRLTGEAKSFDIHCIIMETQRLMLRVH